MKKLLILTLLAVLSMLATACINEDNSINKEAVLVNTYGGPTGTPLWITEMPVNSFGYASIDRSFGGVLFSRNNEGNPCVRNDTWIKSTTDSFHRKDFFIEGIEYQLMMYRIERQEEGFYVSLVFYDPLQNLFKISSETALLQLCFNF